MSKVDLKRDQRTLYAPPTGRYAEVDVPALRYLAVDGSGRPGSQSYQQAVEALFTASYAAKFLSKSELDRDYVVMPLEGLWWSDDMTTFLTREKDRWSWRMLIRQPDWLDEQFLATAVEQARAKSRDPERLLRVVELTEGRCLQTLHLGSYDEEGPILAHLHDKLLPSRGLRPVGRHHEIYLSDARRVAPEKLRTILRQPVAAVDG
ncbi:GyrI-like domain-containing protein [Actinoplanes sp. NPDC048967]|uniref:GyrI-like domain-containing protein n=1 Tax=Actinoplanes sp. NPDC048967 TaxID=3155269 RepID=UPI0033EC5DF4